MEIRFLTPDDAGGWLGLRLEALQRDPEAFSASFEEYQALPIEEVKRRLWSSTDSFVAGAFEGNRLVGMAGFYREQGLKTRHKGRVWGVYVTRTMRGQGVGRKLMLRLLKRALEMGEVKQVLLSVTGTQQAAVALYRSLGFEIFGTEPEALNVGGRLIDEHYLTLRLDRISGQE